MSSCKEREWRMWALQLVTAFGEDANNYVVVGEPVDANFQSLVEKIYRKRLSEKR